ncbi:beta-1,3-galactosyltransferase 6-like [Varroa jacobsoni]|uniref:Hexosyltransferase n=1 Tax=Varroa destructor TaxID=109461 RepID=A0A7M7K126_VARDE|nr:beta-1,3-galactosyltransferase 6-like [Varroa destructor]XP_022658767.1 beta-1,3-galactosyltransferase 6-like [Varroa destructor]XP_022706624.1 beta-1,3-galactosyltransferase 6-like [Varroa jacobsoni]XP_022706625.1 beta-1,3-galactosyltransferase 6-like [Varroa jacobsoni]
MPFKSDNFAALKRRYTRYSIRTAMFFDWHNRRGWNRKIIMCALIVFFTIYIPLIIYHLRATRDKQATTLCVAILSTPNKEGAHKRAACRDSWLTLAPENDAAVKTFFFLGQPLAHLLKGPLGEDRAESEPGVALNSIKKSILEEQQAYGDLVDLPLDDHYANLSLKVLQTIKYLSENEQCKFIFKADDDTFARLDLMLAELTNVNLDKWLYWGYFTGRASVYHKGRWAENNWFLCDRYLPYARGGGYVFSGGLGKFIADYVDVWERYVNEDVSFGAWTAGLTLKRVHDPRFDTEYLSRGCLNSYLVTHKQKPEEMRRKIQNLKNTGQMCDVEGEARSSYEYNWKLPPTQCCDQQYNRRKITFIK